ncbi:MAG: peptidase M1 [Cytophagaceae bacterium]|nr:peptidase M1 [Cytophagaceae bacterium]
MHKYLLAMAVLLTATVAAQETEKQFTHMDTLRGTITPERAWWDLSHYDLNVTVDPAKQYLKGINIVTYKVLKPYQVMQIDLQEPMQLVSAVQDGKELAIKKEGLAHFISLKAKQTPGEVKSVILTFKGKPKVAQRPPWDGGWTWTQDSNGKTFAANANQGIGASIWWPNKDHPYDEVDSLDLRATVPEGLVAVGNGRLVDSLKSRGQTTYHWKVVNPINNYGVNINIGDYKHWHETFDGEKGELDTDFWVLREDLAKAKKQFKDAPKMLKAFEYWLGPYPWYEDSYKLVQAPYLGMEHQSSVTYGNKFENGYLGRDLSGSGWGEKWDYIIIHESAHEWFANNITDKDVADMWIQEGFTTYAENLFVDYYWGKEAASDYVVGMRRNIRNDRPIIGTYNVRHEGSGDMYFKGANILHTLRQLIEDDEKWRSILRGLGQEFYHQTVTSAQVEKYISEQSGIDLTQFWDQYLRTTMIPKIEYKVNGDTLEFRYVDVVDKFDMPVQVEINGKTEWIYPSANWKTKKFDSEINDFKVDRDFYIYAEAK